MVSAKILIVALAVTLAASSPTPTLGLASHIVGGALQAAGDVAGDVLAIPGKILGGGKTGGHHNSHGDYPLQPFGFLAKGITGLAGNVGDILADLVQLRIPATLDDALNAVINVARAVAGIINVVIPGLGSLLGNIVVAIAKILICVLGSPGLTGGVLGDRRGGYGNSKDIPAICRKDYGHKYGCRSYDGAYDSPNDVIKFYNLGNGKSQINDLIKKATRGKGINSLSSSDRTIVELVLKISSYLSRTNKNDWSQKDLEDLSVDVTIMIGVIGNGYSNGYGSDLIDSLFSFVGPMFKSKGLDLSGRKGDIQKKIANCKIHNFGGALQNCGGKYSGSNGGSNSGNNGSDVGGITDGGNGGSHGSSNGGNNGGIFGGGNGGNNGGSIDGGNGGNYGGSNGGSHGGSKGGSHGGSQGGSHGGSNGGTNSGNNSSDVGGITDGGNNSNDESSSNNTDNSNGSSNSDNGNDSHDNSDDDNSSEESCE